MRRELNEEAGKRVTRLLERHGLSLRAADRKTGVNYGTISNMTVGHKPEMESVVRFAQALGEDVNEWLALYGYPPVEPDLSTAWGVVKERSGELHYEPDLEDTDVQALIAQMPERDRPELERIIRAYLSEVRRR